MAKCELWIQPERPDRTYRPGDTVAGQVHVRVTDECRCDDLTIQLQWRTHGKGNRDEGPAVHKQSLAKVVWRPGVYQYPFQFVMPRGPVSYHGQIINVDWYLNARADVPWALDPKAEVDVLLLPQPAQLGAGDGYRDPHKLEPVTHHLGHRGASGGSGTLTLPPKLIAFVGVVVGVVMVIFLCRFAAEGLPPIAIALMAVVMVFGFVGIAARWVANQMALRILGDVSITVEPQQTMRNGQLQVTFRIRPEQPCEVHGLYASLVATEVAVSGSGTNKHTHREKIHDERVVVCGEQRTIAAGEALTLAGLFTVPRMQQATQFLGRRGQPRSLGW